ncbi:YcaO-like family protein [Streptomyces sp. NPDC005395]|uniref:YcaO-like family protein n=1 Tax=Streptomyces sp. NPDC005395 TaxID=3157042 RepID=UPI0033BC6FB5
MRCERVPLHGTVRSRAAQETWDAIAPHLPRYGITRVSRLTGLDYLGTPVWTAIRPTARTLSASQGKGANDLLAKISAAAEAIELWHVEQPMIPALHAPASDLDLPFPLSTLPVKFWHEDLVHLPLEWTTGTQLLSGTPVPVPLGLVQRTARRAPWQPDVFRATSTGLACGNTRDEALLHAMYEVVERDALNADESANGVWRLRIDPASVGAPYARQLIDSLLTAGAAVELALVANAYYIPVCLAYLWTEDYPVHFAGAGCHQDPEIALTRAITEAAQSRLTCIAGTRDDLVSHEEAFDADPPRPPTATDLRPWAETVDGCEPWRGGFHDQAQAVAARIERVTHHEPVCLDLSAADEPLAAVKVICPGTRSRVRRSIPR